MKVSESSNKKKLLLRINEQTWGELAKWARSDMRSINAQIEYLLKQAIEEKRTKLKD